MDNLIALAQLDARINEIYREQALTSLRGTMNDEDSRWLYEQLAITMQRREAGVINNTIGSRLAQESIWYATIHDSVVVLKSTKSTSKLSSSKLFWTK